MTVLILGHRDDEHASHMLAYLQSRQVDVELLDSRSFPSTGKLSLTPESATWRLRLPSGRVLAGSEIQSVYWRNFDGVAPASLPDPEQDYIALNDSRGLFESLLINLPAVWVNSWKAFQLHQTKPVQLAIVAALGVPVPATLISNDAEQILEFAQRHPHCIFKPVQGGAHARRLSATHLGDENLANLSYAPVTIQEEIPGTNLRVFVAGDRVMCCEIRTDAIDFRDDPNPELLACDASPDLVRRSLQISAALDLKWTGIDWRRTVAGDYFFLEANPSPMFLGFEASTGLPLTESLADLLVSGC